MTGPPRVLLRALLLTLGFAAVEAVGGILSGSLALLSDAGHMVTDSAGLALALVAAWMAGRKPSGRYTYGLERMEVVAAIVNGLLMCGIVIFIVVEAIGRFRQPQPVDGLMALVIAALGLLVNLLVVRTLLHGEQTLNTRAALLHVLGDLLGSIAALASGTIILLTGWTPIDPILSLVICALILVSAVRILREGLHIVLEGVPLHLDTGEVGRSMARVPGVRAVHDLHIWQVGSKRVALSAHVVLEDPATWEDTLVEVHAHLAATFDVEHATLQPERPAAPVQIERVPRDVRTDPDGA